MSTTPDIIGPSSIVTSLEWSKKLKEAGWPQDDYLFIWRGPAPQHGRPDWNLGECFDTHANDGCFAAPTAEEILRKLPKLIVHKEIHSRLYITPYENDYEVGYSPQWNEGIKLNRAEESLADAAAAMFVFLAEQKLLPTL